MNMLSSSSREGRCALRLSTEQLEVLGRLGKRIRGHWENASALARVARESGNEAVKEALLCGKALNEAKGALGHGQWLPWLERHCVEVAGSMATAHRWMRMANLSGVMNLEGAGSLLVAYRMVGILPELEREEREVKEVSVDSLKPFVRRLQGVRERVLQWSAEERARLREELLPVIELYHSLLPEAAGSA